MITRIKVVKVVLHQILHVHAHMHIPIHPPTYPSIHSPTHPALTHDFKILLCMIIIQHVKGGPLSDSIQNKTEAAPLLTYTFLNTDS